MTDMLPSAPTRSRPGFTVVAVIALLALVATACDGDETGAPTTTDTGATTTTDTGAPEAWVACESREGGYRVHHPPEWVANDGDVMPPCSLFHQEPFDVPEQTEIPTDIAVAITVEPVVEGDPGGGLGERLLSEREETVDGRTATRVEVEATGEGLYPEGMHTTRWSIPVDDRRIVARTHDDGEPGYERKQEVLDEMMATLVILEAVLDGGG